MNHRQSVLFLLEKLCLYPIFMLDEIIYAQIVQVIVLHSTNCNNATHDGKSFCALLCPSDDRILVMHGDFG
jgi:hypothetical protein